MARCSSLAPLLACLFAAAAALPCPAQEPVAAVSVPDPAAPLIAAIGPGLWSGTLSLRPASGAAAPAAQAGAAPTDAQVFTTGFSVRILKPGRGALADIPEQSMFGYPLDGVEWTGTGISFVLAAMGPGAELKFTGTLSLPSAAAVSPAATAGTGKSPAIVGSVAGSSWKGSFTLAPADRPPPDGESRLEIAAPSGALPGTLRMPAGRVGPVPLVVLLSGAGNADRDGNNYGVPGRNDVFAQLARELAARGVASFRYDKAGSGEAYLLMSAGSLPSLDRHAADAAAVVGRLADMPEVSRIVVAGMNEGGWVGAAALNLLADSGPWADGLALLAASGKSPLSTLRESLAGLDDENVSEAETIIARLLAREPYPEPSPVLADFFAPSRRPWLESWLAFDPATQVAAVPAPVLLVFGDADMQVSAGDFELLLDARPTAAARTVPGMNHALKEVGTDEDANWASFSEPSFGVPRALADLLAAFAKVRPAPGSAPPYERVE